MMIYLLSPKNCFILIFREVSINPIDLIGICLFFSLQLIKLPRSPTVDDILTCYLDYKSKKDAMYVVFKCN